MTGELPGTQALAPDPLRTLLPAIVGSVTAVMLPVTLSVFLAEPPSFRPSSTFLRENTAAFLLTVFARAVFVRRRAVPHSIQPTWHSMKLGPGGISRSVPLQRRRCPVASDDSGRSSR